jgi:hypothetical protein
VVAVTPRQIDTATATRAWQETRQEGFGSDQLVSSVAEGMMTAPFIKIGENRTAWLERELDEWLDAKIAERDAQTVGILGVAFDDRKQHKLWAFGARDVTAQELKQRTRADERARDREGAEARRRTSGRQA